MVTNLGVSTRSQPEPPPFKPSSQPGTRSWLDRLLLVSRRDLAKPALEHLLATRHPADVQHADISQVVRDYHLSPEQLRELGLDLWRRALTAFLSDDMITDQEAEYLTQLRRVFGIEEETVNRVEQELIHPRYEKAVAEALADQHISQDERDALERFGNALRIPPAIRAAILARPARDLLELALARSVDDRRLSPDEQRSLVEIARNLNVTLKFDDASNQLWSRYALLWRMENGDLPQVDVPIKLAYGEHCHFMTEARWLEYLLKTHTVGYHRIMRGVHYRVGTSRPHQVMSQGLIELDHGTLYVTNKRVLFDGQRGYVTFKLKSLISFEVFSDGLGLERGAGRTPYLVLDGDVEVAAIILGRVLAGG